MFSSFYTTNKGSEYLAKSLADKRLVITHGEFGDGSLPSGTSITSLTGLINALGLLNISKKSVTANTLTITTEFSNRQNGSIMSPFYLMEIGLYGKLVNSDGTDDIENPEIMIFYANTLTMERADYVPGTLTEFIINWPLTISESQSVTVLINESLAYPTLEDFNSSVAHMAIAGGTASAIEINVDDVTLADGLMMQVKLANNLVAGATLSLNGSTACPICTMDGEPVKSGAVAGSYLPLTYNEEKKIWFVTGGSSGGFQFVLGGTRPTGPCLWFDTDSNENGIMLRLDVPNEESSVFADIDSVTYEVSNATVKKSTDGELNYIIT